MEIEIYCNECGCDLKITNTQISRQGDLVIDIERCTCADERLIEEGREDARANG